VLIAVNDVAPSGLTYAANPANYGLNVPLPPNLPSYAGGRAVSFSVTPTLPAGIVLDANSGAITGLPTALVSSNNYTVTATNSGGSASAIVNLSVSSTVAMQDWRLQWFGTLLNTGAAADLGDFNHNGIPNLIKYAFGLNPLLASSMTLPQPAMSLGACTISFTEPPGVTGVTYGADYSTDLMGGIWSPVPDTGSGKLHLFSVPVTGSAKAFLRLNVTEQ
jgi:hypothetical protein